MKHTLFTLLLLFSSLAGAVRPDHPETDVLVRACQGDLESGKFVRMPVVWRNGHSNQVTVILGHRTTEEGHVVYSVEGSERALRRNVPRWMRDLTDSGIEAVVTMTDHQFFATIADDKIVGYVDVVFGDREYSVPRYQAKNRLKTGDVLLRDGSYFVILDGAGTVPGYDIDGGSLAIDRYQTIRFRDEPRPGLSSSRLKTLTIAADDLEKDDARLVGHADLKGGFDLKAGWSPRLHAEVIAFTPRPPEPTTLRTISYGNYRTKR